MTIKDWSDLASAFQSFVLAIAVIVGGGWALFQFISLKSIAKARADLEAAKRSLRERAAINTTIEHQIAASPQGAYKCILCTVYLENMGNHFEVLNWRKSSFFATPLSINNGKVEALTDSKLEGFTNQPSDLLGISISPGEKTCLPYAVFVPGPGLYVLTFDATCSPYLAEDIMPELEDPSYAIERLSWATDKIVSVE